RQVDHAVVLDDGLAGRSIDGLLEAFDPLLAHAEGERPEAAGLRVVLGDPGPVAVDCPGQVQDQRPEEALADLARRALEHEAKRSVRWTVAGWQHGCTLPRPGPPRGRPGEGAPEVPSAERGYFFLQWSSPIFCQAPLLSISVTR